MALTYDQTVSASRAALLDGMMTGVPFGDTVAVIVSKAMAFGRSDALSANRQFDASVVRHQTEAELLEEMNRNAIETLFFPMGLGAVVDGILKPCVIFAYQEQDRLYGPKYRVYIAALERLRKVTATETSTTEEIDAATVEFFELAREVGFEKSLPGVRSVFETKKINIKLPEVLAALDYFGKVMMA